MTDTTAAVAALLILALLVANELATGDARLIILGAGTLALLGLLLVAALRNRSGADV